MSLRTPVPIKMRAAALIFAALLGMSAIGAAQPAPDRAVGAPSAPSTQSPAKPTPNLAAPSPEYAEDIREIRGPKYLFPDWILYAIAGSVVILSIVGLLFWRWLKRARPARVLLPFEVALQNLEAIRPLMAPATVRQFSIEVSDIVRRYIEERFNVTAAHRTTEEFLRDLLASSEVTLAKHRNLLSEFLELCDLAKFAGMSLSEANMESLYQSARGFVIETARTEKPRDAATGVTPAGAKEAHDSLSST